MNLNVARLPSPLPFDKAQGRPFSRQRLCRNSFFYVIKVCLIGA